MAESKKKKQKKTYSVEYLIYWYYKGDLKESGIKQKKAFTHLGIHFFRVFNKELENQPESATITINELLENDDDFKNEYESIRYHYDSIGCIKIKSVEVVNDKGEKYNIMNENLTDADENVSIYHSYIHTSLNPNADTIKTAINKGHYIQNPCWVNCLMDFHGDTLMGDKRRPQNKLTVERISQIIGRENFAEKGSSINEMAMVFKEFGIQARIYSFFNKMIF